MKKWFVVHTQPQKELFAAQELKKQGFDVYCPKFLKQRRHARRVETVVSPLFPRYIFVAFDDAETPWRCINGTKGVAYILASSDKPLCMPEQLIGSLKAREDNCGYVSLEVLALFAQGDKVLIVDGPFEGYNATIVSMSENDRVQLLVNFMGRQLEVGLMAQMIEAA